MRTRFVRCSRGCSAWWRIKRPVLDMQESAINTVPKWSFVSARPPEKTAMNWITPNGRFKVARDESVAMEMRNRWLILAEPAISKLNELFLVYEHQTIRSSDQHIAAYEAIHVRPNHSQVLTSLVTSSKAASLQEVFLGAVRRCTAHAIFSSRSLRNFRVKGDSPQNSHVKSMYTQNT